MLGDGVDRLTALWRDKQLQYIFQLLIVKRYDRALSRRNGVIGGLLRVA